MHQKCSTRRLTTVSVHLLNLEHNLVTCKLTVEFSPGLGEVAIDVTRYAPQTGRWTALLSPRFCLCSLQTPRQRKNRRVSEDHSHLHVARVRREGGGKTDKECAEDDFQRKRIEDNEKPSRSR